MRRELPPKPNLEHLKSQAKDLLDAHKRGEPEALARIRAAVPAFARRSDEEIARASFALHDAQSAIAREYGCVSWAELRARIAAGEAPAAATATEANAPSIQTITGRAVPPEVEAEIRAVYAESRVPVEVATPATVPVLPLRNSVVFPGSLVPMDLSRSTSLRAIEVVMQREPRLVAVFAQRAIETDRPTADDLHPKGSLCIVRVFHQFDDPPPSATGEPGPPRARSWILVQGVRWIRLDALEQLDPYYVARVSDADEVRGDEPEIAGLGRELRGLAHRFADSMSNRDQVHAVIDLATEPLALADLVMANFPISVAEKASYAEETQLSRKLDRAIALLTGELAKLQSAPA